MKQEHKYREELQNRRITPSSTSWDTLNEKLTDQEKGEEHGKKWLFLKYAAVLLILISAGFFFFQPKEEIKNNPIIVSPTLKKDIKKLPEINSEPKTEVATAPTTIPKSESINKIPVLETIQKNDLDNEAIVLVEEAFKNIDTGNIKIILEENFDKIEEVIIAKNTKTTEDIDLEIEQLLRKAIIKSKVNNLQNSNKRTISASDLLFQVEEDLDKDLKQKLFDKIVKTLKNPKQVVTDNGN